MNAKRRPFDIWKSMTPRSRLRLAIAVFFIFAAVGPITILTESSLHPVGWEFVIRQSLSLGCFAAAVALFGRKRWWVTLLIVAAGVTVITLNRGGLSFKVGEQGLRVSLGTNLSVTDEKVAHEPVALTAAELDRLYTSRGYLGTMAMVLIAVGYIAFIRLMRDELRERSRLEAEVQISRDIQESLLPSEPFKSDWMTAAGVSLPASEVGGDFFDIAELPDGRVAAAIADVSGHGVGAGTLAAMTKSALRSQIIRDPSPSAVFENLNPTLFDLSEEKVFVTFAYLLFDPRERTIQYTTAGHPPILVRRSRGKSIERLRTQNPALGMKRVLTCASASLHWEAGDSLLLYTDGIVEAANAKLEQFGEERLESAFSRAPGVPAEICASLNNAVRTFTGTETREDDITLLAVVLG